jgi:hypothetical protein
MPASTTNNHGTHRKRVESQISTTQDLGEKKKSQVRDGSVISLVCPSGTAIPNSIDGRLFSCRANSRLLGLRSQAESTQARRIPTHLSRDIDFCRPIPTDVLAEN